MSLLECSECNHSISETAYFCPNCGNVRKKIWLEKSERTYQLLAIMTGLLSGVFFFMSKRPEFGDYSLTFSYLVYFFVAVTMISLIAGWVTSKYDLKTG